LTRPYPVLTDWPFLTLWLSIEKQTCGSALSLSRIRVSQVFLPWLTTAVMVVDWTVAGGLRWLQMHFRLGSRRTTWWWFSLDQMVQMRKNDASPMVGSGCWRFHIFLSLRVVTLLRFRCTNAGSNWCRSVKVETRVQIHDLASSPRTHDSNVSIGRKMEVTVALP